MTHLVDTSVLTRVRRPEVRAIIEPLTVTGQVARAAISDLEIGYSGRNGEEWDRLHAALQVFALVETSRAHVERSRQIQRQLAARHQRGRKVPDLLVAAAAEAENLTLLHYDADFDLIAEVTGQSTAWIVPAGSID